MAGAAQDHVVYRMNPVMASRHAQVGLLVEQGLLDGWLAAHFEYAQPTKHMLLSHLYEHVMDRLNG